MLLTCFLLFLVVGIAIFVIAARSNKLELSAPDRLANLAHGILNFLLFNSVAGITGMAIVEALKTLVFLRGMFYVFMFPRLTYSTRQKLPELLPVAGGGSKLPAVRLDMPIEQFTAQLAAKVDQALGQLAYSAPSQATSAVAESKKLPLILTALLGPAAEAYLPVPNSMNQGEWLARLREDTASRLDALQSSLSTQWRWSMHLAAATASTFIGILALIAFPLTFVGNVALLMGSFVFGGYFAALAHDLLSSFIRRGRR